MWWITCVHEARAQFSLPRSTFRQLTFSTFVGVRNIKGTSRDDAPLRAPSSLRALVPMFVRTRPYVKRFAPHNTTTTKLPKKEGCTFVGARRAAPRGAACGGAARVSGLPRGSWTRPGRCAWAVQARRTYVHCVLGPHTMALKNRRRIHTLHIASKEQIVR